eukprot:TRINITY_DN5080_c0_g3_i1.p1 TRINITY_DN5080_c0_g3~~TRINITY_DN5080_c0_g3_i1.p1  ORF type:complete len:615 (+),score=59.33 TRINITY_DN5080_c0_g3_i1:57-1847(+)
MEVTRDNFHFACLDIEQRLPNTSFIAVDLELTGVSGRGHLEHFSDLSTERLARACELAESFAIVQFGLTLCQVTPFQPDEMTTYNIYVAPESCFLCEGSALKFIRTHGVDLNRWVDNGVRLGYHKREIVDFNSLQGRAANNTFIFKASVLQLARDGGIDLNRWAEEEDISKREPTFFWHCETDSQNSADLFVDWNFGFVRLWHLLRSAGRPLVVHGLIDVFFLLSMEMQRLPRNPKKFARLAKRCFPSGIYDTSYLHEAIDELRFLPMNLHGYHQQVVQRFCSMYSTGYSFSMCSESFAHQAGFDSLLTAELFRCLCFLYHDRVEASKDCLHLHNCGASLDLRRAIRGMHPDGQCFGEDANVTLLVAVMHSADARKNTASRISERAKQDRSFFYRKMNDARFLLVVLRCSGLRAEQKAKYLGSILPGVVWVDFHAWKCNVRSNPPSCAPAPSGMSRSAFVINHFASSSPVRAQPQPFRGGPAGASSSNSARVARGGASSLVSSQSSSSQADINATISERRGLNRRTTACASTIVSNEARPQGTHPPSDVSRNDVRKSGRNTGASFRPRSSHQHLPAPLPVGRVMRPVIESADEAAP